MVARLYVGAISCTKLRCSLVHKGDELRAEREVSGNCVDACVAWAECLSLVCSRDCITGVFILHQCAAHVYCIDTSSFERE